MRQSWSGGREDDAPRAADRKGEHWKLVAAAVFLASDASSYIAGIVLPVDGGLLT